MVPPKVLGVGSANVFYFYALNSASSRNKCGRLAYGSNQNLNFLMQEMHCEANTLGSKSGDKEMTQIAIELKVLIEQMREQVQNIE